MFLDLDKNEGTVVRDRSGKDNDGTVHEASWADGKIGSGLDFDGIDDFAKVDDDASLILSEYTVLMWIKSDEDIGSVYATQTIRKGATGANYVFSWNHLQTAFRKAWAIRTKSNAWYATKYTSDLVKDVWYHIAVTFGGSSLRAFLNGTLETTTSIPEALDPEALEGDLYLCGDPGTVVWFNGKIDEVLIVNRALSATEIADLYTRGIHRLDADTGKAAPFFTEDSLYCLLDNMDTKDLPVEAGLAFQDSRIIRTCSEIKQFDRVRVDGELFEVGTIKPKYIGDTLLCYSALIQKLKMEVQGRANPPSGETCTGEASAGASTIDQAHSRRSLHE